MSDEVAAKNAAWWAVHPDFREKYSKMPYSAASLARSVVHWHHNVESAKHHDPEKLDSELFFLRQYVVDATRAWLLEAQARLEALGPNDWYQWRDTSVEIRNLQVALDDFEWNTRNPMCKP